MPPRTVDYLRATCALVAALLPGACSRPPETAQELPPAGPPSLPPYAVAGSAHAPVLFAPGIISSGEFESHVAFTPDGRTVYFVRSDAQFTRWTIYQSEYTDGRWSTPSVASFSGQYRDADPFVTADGRQLFFISDRPVAGVVKGDMDIWVMDRTARGWSEPRNPGAPLNSPQSEWHPYLTRGGVLYFGSARDGGLGLNDIYRAVFDGQAWQVENLGAPVNTSGDEYEPMIAPDESYLVFMAYRADGLGGSDLYLAWHRKGGWTTPVNLGPPVNSAALELAPALSPDGRYFFFTSTRRVEGAGGEQAGNGLGDIYEIELGRLLGGTGDARRHPPAGPH